MVAINVLLPVQRIDGYVRLALSSLSVQTFRDFSIVLVYNSPSPPTPQELDVLSEFSMPVRLVHHQELGVSSALNAGLAYCDAEYIARMDGDDMCTPDRLSIQYEYLKKNPAIIGVGSFAKMVDSNGDVLGSLRTTLIHDLPEMLATLRFENPYLHPTLMFRAGPLKRYQYDSFMLGCEDWDLWIKFANDGLLMVNLNKELLQYRIHSNQVSQTRDRSGFAAPLLRCLSRLAPSPTDIFPFQRPYLSKRRVSPREILLLILSESRHVRNIFTARKFASALWHSIFR